MQPVPSLSSFPVVVCDMGTGTTRLGYAGNNEPTFVQPTVCAWADPLSYRTLRIGHDATRKSAATTTRCTYRRSLLDHGAVVDWDLYEEYWRHLFYSHLCVEPSEVGLVLTEAARISPAQRETTAEILFESFGVPQLLMGLQALFALSSVGNGSDTALVIESGAGVTQVVPVVDGYALHGAAQHFPLAGTDVTQYVLDRLRAHKYPIEVDRAWAVAERVKKSYSYLAEDSIQERTLFEADPSAHVIHHREVNSHTGQPYEIDVAEERFLAPEILFQPALLRPEWTTALPDLVEAVLWSCPIDCRCRLYANVMLCGGNTRFLRLAGRLEQALRGGLEKRVTGSSGIIRRQVEYDVHVEDCSQDRSAVWKGASLFGASSRFAAEAVTRAEYQERGCFSAAAGC